uniref:GTD-binding domain-containing protein n=1 Tax=Nelumbo nucifera TaxID=4432 RepID=A0A822Y9Q6_NELNU|nr:TPA_asm: hypothetical protein HUJ06_030510 [Nelumbo nucifera]
MFMDTEVLPHSTDFLKCCNCGCSCTLISSTWHRSVKRKFEEFEASSRNVPTDYLSVARVEVENECIALREALSSQQQTIQELYTELEEERNASASAANEAMSMILRLQREKAEIQMEARQFKRFAEEKMAHDQQELLALEDLLYKREQVIQSLTCEVQAYKHRMLSYGLTEAEVEGGNDGCIHTNSMVENPETQFEFPPCNYPPLKCNLNEMHSHHDHENDVADLDKYAFGETPRAFRETPCSIHETPRARELQNLEYRISQLERNPSCSHINGEFSGTRNILEKVVVGQSPRRPRHAGRLSVESSNSFFGLVKETGPDGATEIPQYGEKHCLHTDDSSNMRKVDNASDLGDDMSDRIYTIDSIHHGVSYNSGPEPKVAIGISEDYITTPRESSYWADVGDSNLKNLYMRVQALEAEREAEREMSKHGMYDKAQMILIREIAERFCKEMTSERRAVVPVKKPSIISSFSFMSVLKKLEEEEQGALWVIVTKLLPRYPTTIQNCSPEDLGKQGAVAKFCSIKC